MKQNKSTPANCQSDPLQTSSKIFEIRTTPSFERELKHLKKKYPNIKKDILAISEVFSEDPITGNEPLGKDCYKVRIKISDKHTGKRDGGRLIINVLIQDSVVYMLFIYDKSETSSITTKELLSLLQEVQWFILFENNLTI